MSRTAGIAEFVRRRLPDRRGHEVIEIEHEGIRYTAGIGRYDDGRLAEIFLSAGKADSAVDAAIIVSLSLQHGIDARTIAHALKRRPDGSAAGALGRVLDLALATGQER